MRVFESGVGTQIVSASSSRDRRVVGGRRSARRRGRRSGRRGRPRGTSRCSRTARTRSLVQVDAGDVEAGLRERHRQRQARRSRGRRCPTLRLARGDAVVERRCVETTSVKHLESRRSAMGSARRPRALCYNRPHVLQGLAARAPVRAATRSWGFLSALVLVLVPHAARRPARAANRRSRRRQRPAARPQRPVPRIGGARDRRRRSSSRPRSSSTSTARTCGILLGTLLARCARARRRHPRSAAEREAARGRRDRADPGRRLRRHASTDSTCRSSATSTSAGSATRSRSSGSRSLANLVNLIDGHGRARRGDRRRSPPCSFALLAVVVRPRRRRRRSPRCICGATLAFLRHNYHPARIFMGDSGALALGFVLAVRRGRGRAEDRRDDRTRRARCSCSPCPSWTRRSWC